MSECWVKMNFGGYFYSPLNKFVAKDDMIMSCEVTKTRGGLHFTRFI